jgi:chloramphenicol-sensitive protein RarD
LNYLQAFLAYVLWGIFPLYWKLLPSVNSFEIICHRIIWSLLTLLLCISFAKQWTDIRNVLGQRKRLLLCFVAALLISMNWLIFIWAVQNGYVVESSLGYFINPMMNVVLGVFFFKERLSPVQWIAVSIAVVGLLAMTISTGEFPLLAVALASSFSLYAAVKKMTVMPAVAGLGMETAILAPFAIAALMFVNFSGDVSLPPRTTNTWLLLVMGGPITTLPLVLFAAAAKSVPMVAMGMLQYIAPSMQFAFGILWFNEQVTRGRLLGFGLVWIALILFSSYAFFHHRQRKATRST